MEQLSLTNLPPQTQGDPTMVAPPGSNFNHSQSPDSEIFLDDKNEANEEGSGVTKTIEKYKKKYSNISNDLRMKLLDAVDNKGEKIKHAAKKLGINYSSAKSIYQVFKREGRSNKKAFKRRGLREDSLISDVKTFPTENSKEQQQISHLPTQSSNENPQSEPQDSLMALRDRLLNSRSSGGRTDGNQTESNGGDMLTEQQQQQQQAEIQKPVQYENAKFPIQQQQQQQQQQQVYYLVQYPQAPMIFHQPMMQQGNYGFPQNIQFMQAPPPMSGPSQTININQPQAKNLSIQSITFPPPENHNNVQNNAQSMQGFPSQMPQMQMQNQQQQQLQYLQIQPQNQQFPMMMQPNGYQYQYVQQQPQSQSQPQVIYLMPQGQQQQQQQQIMPGNLQYFNQQQGMMAKSPWTSQIQTQEMMKQKMNTITNQNEVNVASADKN